MIMSFCLRLPPMIAPGSRQPRARRASRSRRSAGSSRAGASGCSTAPAGRSRLRQRGTGTSDIVARRRAVSAGLWIHVLFMALFASLGAGRAVGAEEAGGSKPAGPVYVALPPIVLPVVIDNRVARQAALSLDLELAKGRKAADVTAREPVLYDAFITELYTIFDQLGDARHLIDPALIKAR